MDDGDSFEFFSLRRSPPFMCAADDVFLAGKILPFGTPPLPPRRAERDHDHDQNPQEAPAEDCEAAQPSRRLRAGRGEVAKTNHQKPRSALDCEVAAKSLPPPPSAAAVSAKQRPRWYLYALGSMRVPAKMDLNEIRSRQQRRRCSSAYTTTTSEPSIDANRGTWKLLRSLSCKGVESAGVSVAFVRDLQSV